METQTEAKKDASDHAQVYNFLCCPINNTTRHTPHCYFFFISTESSPTTSQSFSWGKRKERK